MAVKKRFKVHFDILLRHSELNWSIGREEKNLAVVLGAFVAMEIRGEAIRNEQLVFE